MALVMGCTELANTGHSESRMREFLAAGWTCLYYGNIRSE